MKNRQAFDDLIFENRNKNYGAYTLRQGYNKIVLRSMLIAILAGSLIILIPFLKVIGKSNETGTRAGTRYVSVQMDKLEPPKQEIIVAPASPPPPASQPVVKYVPPVIVDTILPNEKPMPTVAEIQAQPQDNNNQEITVSSSASDNELVGDPSGNNGDEPFVLVEVKPTFKGGDLEKFREWIQKRVVYPQEAQENNIRGKVYLTFVVERDGSVSNVNIVRGVDKILDDAAKKAIEASPKWNPGLQRGRPVRVRFSIYLNFQL